MDGFEVPLITRCNVGVGNWLESTWLVLLFIFLFSIYCFFKMVYGLGILSAHAVCWFHVWPCLLMFFL